MSRLDIDRIFDQLPPNMADAVSNASPIVIHELLNMSEEELTRLSNITTEMDNLSEFPMLAQTHTAQDNRTAVGSRRLYAAVQAYADRVEPAKYEELVYRDFIELREKVKELVLKYKDPDACAKAVSSSIDTPFILTVSKAANIYSVIGDPVVFYSNSVYTTFYDYIMTACCKCVAMNYSCTFQDNLIVLKGVLSRQPSRSPYIHTVTITADPRIVSSTDSLNQNQVNKECVKEIQYEYRNNDLHYMAEHDTPSLMTMTIKYEQIIPESDVWDFHFD